MTTHVRAQAIHERQAPDVPVVFMNSSMGGSRYDAFDIENRQGAYAAVRHLVERGHERIATITGPPDSYDVRERLAGYRQALEEDGLDTPGAYVVHGDFTQASGYTAGGEILQLDPLPDAVFSCNDYMAIGAMAALQEAGVDVPGDIAIAGFDDIPSARYANPSLTTVRVPVYDLGRQAAERLIHVIQGTEDSGTEDRLLGAKLVVRSST